MGWDLVVPSMCLPQLEENKHHGQKPLGGEKGLFHHTDYSTQDLHLPPDSSPLQECTTANHIDPNFCLRLLFTSSSQKGYSLYLALRNLLLVCARNHCVGPFILVLSNCLPMHLSSRSPSQKGHSQCTMVSVVQKECDT